MISITDEAIRAGVLTQGNCGVIAEKLLPLKERFDIKEIQLDANDIEHIVQVSGVTPNHGPLVMEVRISRDMPDVRPEMFAGAAYDCLLRDLAWLESGRCLGSPSTAQLKAARAWLADHLGEIENKWRFAAGETGTVEATPEPLHAHLHNVLAALMPVEVEDAHLERAKEVKSEIVSTSTAEPGQRHPRGHAIKIIAAAIAEAEVRGTLKSADLLEEAWGIIANAGGWDDPSVAHPGWKATAERWRDQYHKAIK